MARYGDLAVRGPRFGVLAQDPSEAPEWRVVVSVTAITPQEARDELHSMLWFRAKDEAKDVAERRSLLAAVARLERERADDLTAAGTRFRVVRAEEYARTGPDGMEPPRPTDPEPLVPDWSPTLDPYVDDGAVVDPDAPVTPAQAAERLSLRDLCYTGGRFPEAVLEDSLKALDTHRDIVLLPPTFTVVERSPNGWRPHSGPHATAHSARKSLDFSLTWEWPRKHGLLPADPDGEFGVRPLIVDDDTDVSVPELAVYVEAVRELRSGRVIELTFQDTTYQIARTCRLLRWSPVGPEGPRPSDIERQDPDRMHPPLDENGVILPED
ncbi:DUF5954 family protein [Streptomyces sp. NPDC057638]|uniref:DUF5954 family protein n=1 Tax=Streptomyces sp. NPDC057638 TaxID=3346190 RepID=UPI0036972D23